MAPGRIHRLPECRMPARSALSASVLFATAAFLSGGKASAAESPSVTDWSTATRSGWAFLDGRTGGHDGRIRVLDGRLRLEDDADGKPDWAEAALALKGDFSV